MIAAPVIGVAPKPELTPNQKPNADTETKSFASIMQTVAPASRPTGVDAQPQVPASKSSAEIDTTALVEPPLIIFAAATDIDCERIAAKCACLQVAPKAIVPPDIPVKEAPEEATKGTKVGSDDGPLDLDAIVSQPTESLTVKHRMVELPTAAPNPDKQALASPSAGQLPQRVAAADALVPILTVQIDRVEVQLSGLPEPRGLVTVAAPSDARLQPGLVDRGPAFAPMLTQIARDVLALSADRDVRFNLRPDVLGPVAVTIERTDAGTHLRLGVETQSAVQALRAAEPMLNDGRSAAPFVQVSVDMNAPDQRSRHGYRPAVALRRDDDHSPDIFDQRGPVAAGRYA
jgi:hypothetical protein